jgi:hypothetical protein
LHSRHASVTNTCGARHRKRDEAMKAMSERAPGSAASGVEHAADVAVEDPALSPT